MVNFETLSITDLLFLSKANDWIPLTILPLMVLGIFLIGQYKTIGGIVVMGLLLCVGIFFMIAEPVERHPLTPIQLSAIYSSQEACTQSRIEEELQINRKPITLHKIKIFSRKCDHTPAQPEEPPAENIDELIQSIRANNQKILPLQP